MILLPDQFSFFILLRPLPFPVVFSIFPRIKPVNIDLFRTKYRREAADGFCAAQLPWLCCRSSGKHLILEVLLLFSPAPVITAGILFRYFFREHRIPRLFLANTLLYVTMIP